MWITLYPHAVHVSVFISGVHMTGTGKFGRLYHPRAEGGDGGGAGC